MRHTAILIALIAALPRVGVSQGQAERFALVQRLFRVTHMDQKWRETNLAYINELVRLHPSLTQYRDILTEWQLRVLNWDSVSTPLTRTISSRFTTGELDTLIAFYESPVGRKWVGLATDLNKQWAALQAKLVQDNYPDLVARLQARAVELHKPNPLEM